MDRKQAEDQAFNFVYTEHKGATPAQIRSAAYQLRTTGKMDQEVYAKVCDILARRGNS